MKITTSTVTKHTITGGLRAEGLGTLDPISVIEEDFAPGQGKVTISCFGEAWQYYWGAMGEHHTLRSFFLKADVRYLAGKLAPGTPAEVEATDGLEALMYKEVVRQRRADYISRDKARDLWGLVGAYDRRWDGDGLLFELFGDEYWYCLPRVKNPQYEYLCDIILAVKAAFKQLTEEKQT